MTKLRNFTKDGPPHTPPLFPGLSAAAVRTLIILLCPAAPSRSCTSVFIFGCLCCCILNLLITGYLCHGTVLVCPDSGARGGRAKGTRTAGLQDRGAAGRLNGGTVGREGGRAANVRTARPEDGRATERGNNRTRGRAGD